MAKKKDNVHEELDDHLRQFKDRDALKKLSKGELADIIIQLLEKDEVGQELDLPMELCSIDEVQRRKRLMEIRKMNLQYAALRGKYISKEHARQDEVFQAMFHIMHLKQQERTFPALLEGLNKEEIRKTVHRWNKNILDNFMLKLKWGEEGLQLPVSLGFFCHLEAWLNGDCKCCSKKQRKKIMELLGENYQEDFDNDAQKDFFHKMLRNAKEGISKKEQRDNKL